jgi:hypothetical protein
MKDRIKSIKEQFLKGVPVKEIAFEVRRWWMSRRVSDKVSF